MDVYMLHVHPAVRLELNNLCSVNMLRPIFSPKGEFYLPGNNTPANKTINRHLGPLQQLCSISIL